MSLKDKDGFLETARLWLFDKYWPGVVVRHSPEHVHCAMKIARCAWLGAGIIAIAVNAALITGFATHPLLWVAPQTTFLLLYFILARLEATCKAAYAYEALRGLHKMLRDVEGMGDGKISKADAGAARLHILTCYFILEGGYVTGLDDQLFETDRFSCKLGSLLLTGANKEERSYGR